ncbi:MAG: hypothetical protein J7K23_08040 [Thermoproteales archaeon]|nr:hypothetical protein [Thermoproteales archaeon]
MNLNKLILIIGAIVVISSIIVVFRPWDLLIDYRIRYIRNSGVEVAEALDNTESVRAGIDFYVENFSVTVSIYKPNEKPIILNEKYSRISAPVPRDLSEVVRGRPEKSFERFRRTAVYFNHTHIVIDPKPIVEYFTDEEYGRRVHIFKITLIKIRGQLRKGATLYYNSSHTVEYLRTYDYSGVSKICITGQEAYKASVHSGEILKIIIVYEEWIAQ